jgi:hypothetical protein
MTSGHFFRQVRDVPNEHDFVDLIRYVGIFRLQMLYDLIIWKRIDDVFGIVIVFVLVRNLPDQPIDAGDVTSWYEHACTFLLYVVWFFTFSKVARNSNMQMHGEIHTLRNQKLYPVIFTFQRSFYHFYHPDAIYHRKLQNKLYHLTWKSRVDIK